MSAATELARALKAKRSSSGWTARCPAHDDHRDSLSFSDGEDGRLLAHCFTGCKFEDILAAAGIPLQPPEQDRAAPKPNGHARPKSNGKGGKIVATYDYQDEHGAVLYQVVRKEPKDFLQRRPDGKGGWTWGLRKDIKRVPYHLPEILKSTTVMIVEGEKDADRLRSLGFTATTNSGGAAVKWPDTWGAWFRGRHVTIIPDNDDAGRQHGNDVATKLAPFAASVKVLWLKGLPDKGDVSDWLDQGHSAKDLQDEIDSRSAPVAAPPSMDDLTEDGLALLFTEAHKDTLRYVKLWGSWLLWNGYRWQREQTALVFDRARSICRLQASYVSEAKTKARLRSAATRASVESMAQSDRRHASTTDQWDQDIMLLGGERTIDLRTGQARTPDQLDYITKSVACVPSSQPPTLWLQCLNTWTDGDQDLQDYLQRMCGYMLTGSIKEEVFFFAYGLGKNGKTKFAETIKGIMGDYAGTMGSEVLMQSPIERHPTEIARLQGLRLVVASEIESGKAWAESKIKAMTGGDRLPARFMRQDIFEFDPQFKLMIIGNNKPSLSNVSEAIRRRLHLVPFTVTISEDQRDPDLAEKLKAERPRILGWMIEGCQEWQRIGLCPPKRVLEATEEYLSGEDTFARWQEDCITVVASGWEASADLWSSWQAWCTRMGEIPGTQRAFSNTLAERGFVSQPAENKAKTRGYKGVRIIRPNYTDDPRTGS